VFRRNPDALESGKIFLPCPFRISLLFLVDLVEPLHEEQIGDLLNGCERIGDAASPELVPELIYFAFEFGVVLEHGLN